MSLLPRTQPLTVCPICGAVHPTGPCPPSMEKPQASRVDPAPPSSLPETVPPDATAPAAPRTPSPKASPRVLPDEKIRSFVDQGIIIEEDARGLRLTGRPVRGRGKATGQLSATDIVRLAADLDGGVLSADQRMNCPHCDAVLPLEANRCPWCGQSLARS